VFGYSVISVVRLPLPSDWGRPSAPKSNGAAHVYADTHTVERRWGRVERTSGVRAISGPGLPERVPRGKSDSGKYVLGLDPRRQAFEPFAGLGDVGFGGLQLSEYGGLGGSAVRRPFAATPSRCGFRLARAGLLSGQHDSLAQRRPDFVRGGQQALQFALASLTAGLGTSQSTTGATA